MKTQTSKSLLSFTKLLVLMLAVSLLGCEKATSEADLQKIQANAVIVYYEDKKDIGSIDKVANIGQFNLRPNIYGMISCWSELPYIVVFRGIPEFYKEEKVKVGHAYIHLSENEFRHLKSIDLSLSDLQIAALFGVAPKGTSERNLRNAVKIKVIDKETGAATDAVIFEDKVRPIGKAWQEEGVFIRDEL